jgi:hypothetical protein
MRHSPVDVHELLKRHRAQGRAIRRLMRKLDAIEKSREAMKAILKRAAERE